MKMFEQVIEEGENHPHPVSTYGSAGRYVHRYNSSMTEEIPSKEEKSVDGFCGFMDEVYEKWL